MRILLGDIGSTYSKLTLVDLKKQQVLAQASACTSIESSVMVGVQLALSQLRARLLPQPPEPLYQKALFCSSAAGGLKMVAIGLSKGLTAEAAKRSALGAGARILKTFHYFLSDDDLSEITRLKADIILLAGGTDYGNTDNILSNAKKLLELESSPPVVVAGNVEVAEEVSRILSAKFPVYLSENVMPAVNEINPDPVRRVIRQVFMSTITKAKGLSELSRKVGPVLMPTPDAVLEAAKLLSRGTEKTQGLGDLLLIDIGGATTDVHSIGEGLPDPDLLRKNLIRFEGLREPLAKRTVEGDLGLRYSAPSLYESLGEDRLRTAFPCDFAEACAFRAQHVDFIPDTPEEIAVDQALAHYCAMKALQRHGGSLRSEFRQKSNVTVQKGKDLSRFGLMIGTGGVLVHSPDPQKILQVEAAPLLPQSPHYAIDKLYLISAMGLLSTVDAEAALKILKDKLLFL
ncbi:MAG: methylaspartate mutase accessory protein GlmL [Clostridiales bacterium]|nr:methylaspartate mutase accessory protein GlmL [Clostridiales bacterium]MDD7433104.1 methylaspartate mutase accessory protein GlmL [Clostridiales bacterium]MDY3061981.1 methylaspartate mutase accessory protein GlmL [Eubacteriales bacterium]